MHLIPLPELPVIMLLVIAGEESRQTIRCMIANGSLRVTCSDTGINIFWNDVKVTQGPGLNVSINTLSLWTDSTKADWQILEKRKDGFKAK